ncbi:ras-related protein Rab-38 [Anableps anableps]
MQNNHHKEHLYKILVIGDLGVGKTSIIKRYVHHNFSPNYRATIGVDFALKVLTWDQETVRLQLWDIAGQERFGNMTRVYYREAMGAFIVFDVTRPTSFEAVTKWKEDLDSKLTLANGKNVATVLLANKCDQGREVLTNNGIKMDHFCQENGFVGWFETSAKENINIDEAANCLVKHIIASENDMLQSEVPDIVTPQLEKDKGGTCSSCFRSQWRVLVPVLFLSGFLGERRGATESQLAHELDRLKKTDSCSCVRLSEVGSPPERLQALAQTLWLSW